MRNVVSKIHSPTDYVTVSELRDHLHITSNLDDAYILNLLNGVFDMASNYLGYQICKSTVDYFFKSGESLHIPARIVGVSSVKYRDSNGDLQTLSATDYDEVLTISANYGYDVTLINAPSSVYSYGWLYKVTVSEGFERETATADESKKFPYALRNAIFLLCEHFYTQRGTTVVGVSAFELPFGHEYILSPYKIMEFV